MRLLSLALLCAGALAAQIAPRVGIIQFYGIHRTSEARIRRALGIAEGDKLPGNKAEVEERLTSVPGVVAASLSVACCEDAKAILYVGIEERGARHFDVRTPPDADVELPEDVRNTYRKFLLAVADAASRGEVAEDLTKGHSLMAADEPRDLQLRFVALADKYPEQIRTVLRTSADEEQRAIAAYVMGYSTNKAEAAQELQQALKDPDDTVRGNAIRALAALAVYAHLNPDSGVRIAPTWFIEMLNSVYWTDRNNAAVALVNMTETRDESVLAQLRERAAPALLEMARWRHLPHALPAYILLGRVAGMPEAEIQDTWSRDDREQTLKTIAKLLKI